MATAQTPQLAARRGLVQVEIGGKLRTFKFGMNALIAFSDLYTGAPTDFAEQLDKNIFLTLRNMAYCGLVARAEENELPEDFSSEMVGDWVDEMAQQDWALVQSAILGAMALGNPSPPPAATPV